MMEIKIERLTRSEANKTRLIAYYKLLDSSFEPVLSSYVNLEQYASKLADKAYVEILYLETDFVGLIALYMNEKEMYLTSLAVLEQYKGKGYATVLMQHAIELAKEAKLPRVKLEVKASDKRTHSFHQKHGFVACDQKTANDSTFYMELILQE